MRIAIGYRWFPTAAGFHIERALRQLGHEVDYAGLPSGDRPGYTNDNAVTRLSGQGVARPDLYLWVDPAGPYFPRGIEDAPFPTACYLIDVHLGRWRESVAGFFDTVFVAQKSAVDRFQRATGHDQVYWLPLAAAGDVHRDHQVERIYDVGFVGNIARAHQKTSRARRLALVTRRFNTNDFYRSYTPEETGAVYSRSRIVLNSSISGDVTMRVFEGAACGALVLTDQDALANGLGDLFDVGAEIVTYRDDADMADKIAYYLARDAERDAIARAGQRRALQQHVYTHRAQAMLQTVAAAAPGRPAPMRSAGAARRLQARRDIYTHLYMLEAILDESRAAGYNPIRRAWAILPCLARRLLA